MKSFKIIIIILCAVSCGLFVLLTLEVRHGASLKGANAEIVEHMKDIKKKSKDYNRMKNDFNRFQDEVAALNARIPQDEFVPLKLIKALSILANQEKLRKIEIVYDDKPRQAASSQETRADSARIASLYITMNFEAEFGSVLSFLKRAGEIGRLITIESINVVRADDVSPRQRIKLVLVTYTFATDNLSRTKTKEAGQSAKGSEDE
jgi:hypothetical protein